MAVVDSGRRTSSGATVWKAAPSKTTSTGGSGGDGGGSSYSEKKKGVYKKQVIGGKTVYTKTTLPAGTKTYMRTAGGYYSSKTGKSYASPTEAAKAEATAPPVVETKKWYYDPTLRVTTTKRIEGQRAMTKQEALSVIKNLPIKTKIEYGKQYGQYTKAKQDVQRAEISALAEPISLREAIAPQVPPPTKATKYKPTALGGLQKAWGKLRTVPDIVWEKVKEKYTPKQLVKGAQDIGKFSGQLQKTIKVKEVKDVRGKVKEKAKPVVGVISKGFQWAKGEFWPEIKSEAQKLKGIRDWNKDMEKIENVFLKAREGYVWAEVKAKEWKPKPIVKQPAFLKGIDPYKGFREQTKRQVVGVAQIGKVTMGATTGVVEDIKLKPYKLPLIYATGVVAGPVATKLLGAGKVAKAVGFGFGTTLATGVGVQVAVTPPGLEREKVIGVKAAEIAAFIGGAKYGIEKKPLAKLYKTKVIGPRFERSVAKWQKKMTAKGWNYLEKRAFIPSKKMPQRTLYGEPISPKKIKWLRGDVGQDILRHELPKELAGYEKLVQKPLRDIYIRKAIDWRYPKVVSITPKTMVTKGYKGILGTQPEMFTFKKPPLIYRADITKFDTSIQTMLAPKVMKVTKYDRPFYIGKPKLPKPVKLGKPSKITPVHITKPKPIKVKPTEVMPGVSARPVYAAPLKPTPLADVGVVLGTIPKGTALAGAIALGGMRFGVRDLSGALQSQFGAARQRAEQKQAAKLGQELEEATKQAAAQAAKQVPKFVQPTKQIPEQIPKQIPKQIPRVITIPKLDIPTIQIPVTIPTPFPHPKPGPRPKPEPKPKPKPLPFVLPAFKFPSGKILKKKKKKLKPFKFGYSPSLVAVSKKITIKEMKMPKYLTGVGIRPIKF